MKHIAQFVYTEDKSSLTSNILTGVYGNTVQLGIQAPVGTIFYLNEKANTNSYPIQIGATGIYEIDVENYGVISSLRFKEESLNVLDENNIIIVDIVYTQVGANV